MYWRLSLLIVVVCALVSAGCSGDDAPKPSKPGPTTQVTGEDSALPA